MSFVVSTQFLENYGAHSGSGRFADGEACWKFKGGDQYKVTGVSRIQDAVAYVAALVLDNGLAGKEFPVEWCTYSEWVEGLPEDEDYRDFLYEQLREVDPRD